MVKRPTKFRVIGQRNAIENNSAITDCAFLAVIKILSPISTEYIKNFYFVGNKRTFLLPMALNHIARTASALHYQP
jgi:hypothetical protein